MHYLKKHTMKYSYKNDEISMSYMIRFGSVNIWIDFRDLGISSLFYEYNSKNININNNTDCGMFSSSDYVPNFGRMNNI